MCEENTNEDVAKKADVIEKEVKIDIEVNGERFKGTVTVTKNLGNGQVSVDTGEMYVMLCEDACYNGVVIAKLYDLIRWEAMYQAGEPFSEGIMECYKTNYHAHRDSLVLTYDQDYCFENLTTYFEPWDTYVISDKMEERRIRHDDRKEWFSAPEGYFDSMYYCEECDCYVDSEDWDSEWDCCSWCADAHHGIIEGYSESHDHDPILFGEYEDEETFSGLGFELEVDCGSDTEDNNNYVATNLCSRAGLAYNEMRFAHDGSLNHGFECISQPHTVKDFWDKQENWQKMLKYLSSQGYRSHDTRTCGLHVHVSRNMFGKSKTTQDTAIAKVYSFFDDNWEDIVKVSRRNRFDYCSKNRLYDVDYDNVSIGKTTKYDAWKKKSKYERGHYVALNNANRETFEYRLGRGTLNPWSFFAWIDLVVTITNNSRRITIAKVNTNDLVSWLGGIKESTARYIYKRGAFRDTMVALFPSIEWEQSTVDNSDN